MKATTEDITVLVEHAGVNELELRLILAAPAIVIH